ncbi:hypothetical protein FQN57_006542 [Myotisia sp. PD_48]|nr:hypothetical protein FQN57_006542 [Myotisia sp. PD_48]
MLAGVSSIRPPSVYQMLVSSSSPCTLTRRHVIFCQNPQLRLDKQSLRRFHPQEPFERAYRILHRHQRVRQPSALPWWKTYGGRSRLSRRKSLGYETSSCSGWERKQIDVKRAHLDREFEDLKRAIDADPFGALFGNRLEPFQLGKNKAISIFQSCFDKDNWFQWPKERENKPSKDHRSLNIEKEVDNYTSRSIELEFDPISGRMVPKYSGGDAPINQLHNNREENDILYHNVTKTAKLDDTPAQRLAQGSSQSEPGWKQNRPPSKPTPEELFTRYKEYIEPSCPEHQVRPHLNQPKPRGDLEAMKKDFSSSIRENATFDEKVERLEDLSASDVRAAVSERISAVGIKEANNWQFQPSNSCSPAESSSHSTAHTESAMHAIQSHFKNNPSESVETTIKPLDSQLGETKLPEDLEPESRTERHSVKQADDQLVSVGRGVDITGRSLESRYEELIEHLNQLNDTTAALVGELRETIQQNVWLNVSSSTHDDNESRSLSNDMLPNQRDQYRILSFDKLADEIVDVTVKSTSSIRFKPLHIVSAISKLAYPSKLLVYAPKLEAEGYTIYSALENMLVFKRTTDGITPNSFSSDTDTDFVTPNNKPTTPSDETVVRKQESSYKAEPRSFAERQEAENETLHKSPNSSWKARTNTEPQPMLRSVARRVVLAGVITGSTCYAIGVVVEYFRTGGQDGLGPQGFTGLEGR